MPHVNVCDVRVGQVFLLYAQVSFFGNLRVMADVDALDVEEHVLGNFGCTVCDPYEDDLRMNLLRHRGMEDTESVSMSFTPPRVSYFGAGADPGNAYRRFRKTSFMCVPFGAPEATYHGLRMK